MGSINTKQRGDWGEAQVAAYLRERGYRILASKYRCRYGELDLIAQDGETVCFVEVKLRSGTGFGLPREYVTAAKQQKLRTAAEYWLSRHDPDVFCRFDVAEVYPQDADLSERAHIIYLENAF